MSNTFERDFFLSALANEEAKALALNGRSRRYVDSNLAVDLGDSPFYEPQDWEVLRPHHFDFSEAVRIRPKAVTIPPDGKPPSASFYAVSVIGTGFFQAAEGAKIIRFDDGGIIVRGDLGTGSRYKLYTLAEFKGRFIRADGREVDSLYEIDFQTPKK